MSHYGQASTEWWRPQRTATVAAVEPSRELSGSESMVPLWALVTFTAVLLLAPQQSYPVLAPFRPAMLSAVFALLSLGCARVARGQPLVEMSRPIWVVVLLAGWAVVTVPFSYWPGGTVSYLLREYFKTLVVFVLLVNIVDTVPKLRRTAWTLVICSIPLSLTSIRNFMAGVEFAANTDRIAGYNAPLSANPNDLALLLNLILPICIALFLASRRALVKLGLAGIACLLVAGVVFTFSRAGFLTLGVMFITYLWILRNRPERVWAPLALVLALASTPFLPPSYIDRMSTIINIEEDTSGSAQNRWRDIKAATGFILRNPVVGAGAGQNVLAMNEIRGPEWVMVHNVYLELGMDLGLPGLILFLVLYKMCMNRSLTAARKTFRHRQADGLFYLAEGVQVSLIAFAVEAFFHPVAYNFYFYYFAGLAIAVNTIAGKQYGETDRQAS